MGNIEQKDKEEAEKKEKDLQQNRETKMKEIDKKEDAVESKTHTEDKSRAVTERELQIEQKEKLKKLGLIKLLKDIIAHPQD